MTRTALLIAAIAVVALSVKFAMHLVYGWRPAPRRDVADEMCPNCLTPWKCNGPHRHWDALPHDPYLDQWFGW